jgi:hypothetical protein
MHVFFLGAARHGYSTRHFMLSKGDRGASIAQHKSKHACLKKDPVTMALAAVRSSGSARTHPELARILQPLQVEFRERFNTQAVALFPEWQEDLAGFGVAMTLSQTMLEGMAINLATGAMDQAMVDPMLAMLETQIRSLNPKLAKA